MRINNYDDEDHLLELENKEYKSKYKYKMKKIKENFSFQDLLTEEQVEKLNNYKGGSDAK